MKKLFQFGPVVRISIGIISLLMALILLADTVLGILPSHRKMQAEHRAQVSNLLGSQITMLLSQPELANLQKILDQSVTATPELRSIGVRKADGTLLVGSRGHSLAWAETVPLTLTLTHVTLPLLSSGTRWGTVELVFHPVDTNPVIALLREPGIALTILLGTAGLLFAYLYLKRALYQLNPSNAVPHHVREAFNVLVEAIVILDGKGRIMLANTAFIRLSGLQLQEVEGKQLSSFHWLISGMTQGRKSSLPWERDFRAGENDGGKEITVTLPDERSLRLQMNYSAIQDGGGTTRGCLISFNDVTALSTANTKLKRTLHELEASRDQIARQNEELQKHAHFDHLTGCLNRRAFFAKAEPLFQEIRLADRDLACIMVDIDHFKSFNDTYGHSVGDLVIQQVGKNLGGGLRTEDILCRYGGEEFCVVLMHINRQDGVTVAERLRAALEAECGPGVRSVPGLRITASLGFASLQSFKEVSTLEQLIDLADQALYTAKRGGRNRVADAADEPIAEAEPEPVLEAKTSRPAA